MAGSDLAGRVRFGFRPVSHPDGSVTCETVLRAVKARVEPCRMRAASSDLKTAPALTGPVVELDATVPGPYIRLDASTDTPLTSGQWLAIYEPGFRGPADLVTYASSTSKTVYVTPRGNAAHYVAVVTNGSPPASFADAQVVAQSAETAPAADWSVGRSGVDQLTTNYTLASTVPVQGGGTISVSGDAQVAIHIADRNVQFSMCGIVSADGTLCQANSAVGPCVMTAFAAGGGWTTMYPTDGSLYGGPTAWPCDPPKGDSLLSILLDCAFSCDAGDPVDTASGSFHESFTDVAIGGRGPGLSLTRRYSSAKADKLGWFGYGWASTFETRLDIIELAGAATRINFIDGRGGQTTFVETPSGKIIGPDIARGGLVKNPDGTYLLSDWRSRLSWKFNASGVLQRVTDANGEWIDLNYTGGKLATVTDRAGRSLTFTWTGDRVTKVTDPMGRFATYGYVGDELRNTTSMAGTTTTFTYQLSGSDHWMTKRQLGGGGYVRNVYALGKVTDQYIVKAGTTERRTQFAYAGDPTSKTTPGRTTVTDDHGVVTEYSYKRMRLAAVTAAKGTTSEATTSFEYDPVLGKPTKVTDPRLNETRMTYNGRGDQVSVVDPSNKTSVADYNSAGQITCSVNPHQYGLGVSCPTSGPVPLGAVGYTYDGNGNLHTVTNANGNTITYTRGSTTHPGDVTSVEDAEHRVRNLSYDVYGNLATASVVPDLATGLALTSQRVYNANSQLTCSMSPRFYSPTAGCPAPGGAIPAGASGVSYDALGRVSSIVNAKGLSTTFTYNVDNKVTDVTDQYGTTKMAYDKAGRPTSVTTGYGTTAAVTTSYGYDIPAGTACSTTVVATAKWCSTVTSNSNKVTKYFYTPRGQLAGWQLPGGMTRTTTYRTDNRPSVITLPGGATVTLDYFSNGWLKSQTSSGAAVGTINYTYRDDGRRLTMVDTTGTTQYEYDAAGRLTATVDGASQRVEYTRDDTGRIQTIKYPSGRVVERGYDNAGRWNSVNDGAGNVTGFTLDGDGAVSGINYPNGNTLTVTRDNLGGMRTESLKNAAGTELASFDWSRNKLSLVTAETGTGPVAQTPNPSYAFDESLRMDAVNGAAYSYNTSDQLNNLGGPSQTYTSTGVGQLATSTNSAGTVKRSYTYNAAGNLTASNITLGSATKYGYTWNALNQLTRATVTPSGGTATTYDYTYDGDGLRVSRTTGGTTTRYVYHRVGRLPQLLVEASREYIYGPYGQPIEQINTDNTSISYFTHDQHGDTRILTGTTGAITATYVYTPYGDSTRTSGTASTAMRYGMGHYDTETGNIYLINRYYDPNTGRFLSLDPLVAHTGDAYGYGQAPLNMVDPLGLECWWDPTTWSWETWAQIGLTIVAPILLEAAITALAIRLFAVIGPRLYRLLRAADELVDAAKYVDEIPAVIYRGGGKSPSNFRLREGEDALSFRDSLSNPLSPGSPVMHPGKDWVGLDTSKLPGGSVVPDGVRGSSVTPPGHVSVYVHDPMLLKEAIIEWGKFPK